MAQKQACPNRAANQAQCACKSKDCERNGVCCECIAYHRGRGEKPMCLR